ncbi:hypothetical protein QU481_23315 [Crenobacter sp. SG2303]|uniref:Carboxypeptidase regulatory-like domain-containing protein n=1 Tax=Crenobacter oryzisoli TaxID=3056844 RepID=A0ABT7XVX9_9NEIS|nr:hypothetical protein [Crenobacter sp. SG2303]MDN0077739.1 hypothetical protein [Crenobacter sp. SG2303]
MKSIYSLAFSRVAFFILLGVSPVALQVANGEPIDGSAVQLEPQQQNGISYLSGGIGLDESQALKQAKGYNLHMTFSEGASNEYLAGIDVDIQAMKGGSVLSLSQAGPYVYVKLPAGRYFIIIGRNGHEERRAVALSSRSIRNVNFHWSDGRQASY